MHPILYPLADFPMILAKMYLLYTGEISAHNDQGAVGSHSWRIECEAGQKGLFHASRCMRRMLTS